MRILYVCADRGVPLCGSKGASSHLRGITSALVGRGHHVTVACRRVDGDNDVPPGLGVQLMPPDESRHAGWLEGVLRRMQADALLERYSLSSGPALVAARRCDVPFVLEVNAPLVAEAARFRGLTEVAHWARREARLFAAADHIVAVSEAVAAHASAAGADPRRVTVVPNGVETARFADADGSLVRRRHGLEGSLVVGFCGSLKPWHGVLDLISVAGTLPHTARLLVVGDGPERDAIAEGAGRLGLTHRVVLTGAVRQSEVPGHLAAMDVAVAPYSLMPDFYFSPLKVVEYLAAGLPVVASDQGELRLLDGATVLVPPSQPVRLGQAIRDLLEDPERRRAMSAAAREHAAGRDWHRIAERVEVLLRPVMAA